MSETTESGEDLPSKSQWVDRYLLRYGPATILGAILAAYFYSKRRDFGLNNSLLLEKYELVAAMLAIGFLLAYVASAPILVFHCGRSLYLGTTKSWFRKFSSWGTGAIVVTTVTCLAVVGVPIPLAIPTGGAIAIWVVTLVLAFAAYFGRKAIFHFYQELCERRSLDKSGFAESYRTMREHGNAFYILIWEIFLAAPLAVAAKLKLLHDWDDTFLLLLVVLVLWIAPATVAWYVASRLEVDFAESSEEKKDVQTGASQTGSRLKS